MRACYVIEVKKQLLQILLLYWGITLYRIPCKPLIAKELMGKWVNKWIFKNRRNDWIFTFRKWFSPISKMKLNVLCAFINRVGSESHLVVREQMCVRKYWAYVDVKVENKSCLLLCPEWLQSAYLKTQWDNTGDSNSHQFGCPYMPGQIGFLFPCQNYLFLQGSKRQSDSEDNVVVFFLKKEVIGKISKEKNVFTITQEGGRIVAVMNQASASFPYCILIFEMTQSHGFQIYSFFLKLKKYT